jgi:hypothetical protein
MAGEYSREFSVKVFAGQCRLIELGYRQGGPPGLVRRKLIGQSGEVKGTLARGEQKSIQTDRVVLVPGPPEEQDTVREDIDRNRVLIRRASATRDRSIFITEAMRKLFGEETFITLLRAEGLDTLPKNLGDRIQAWARA